MVYEVRDIMQDIRIALDQNMTSTQLIDTGDIDTLSLDEIIESKIADAARIVESVAPIHLLDGGKDFSNSVGWNGQVGLGSGFIHLPDDFLRLVSFQMSDWSRAISIAISEDHPLYARQSSRFAGIRGCPQNPVVAITTQPIGQVLEFYSCTAGDKVYVKRARYIPIPKIEEGCIELCHKLKPAIVYYAAYLVALSIGQADLATTMLNISNELQK